MLKNLMKIFLKKINYKGNPEEIDQDYMKKFGLLKKQLSYIILEDIPNVIS